MIPGSRPHHCYLCGRWVEHPDTHHCLHGSRRQAADKYGLTVYLCRSCHRALHDKGIGDLQLRQDAQRYFESSHSHEEWMEIFGKNYL